MKKLLFAAFLIYFLLATLFTYPLIFKMSSATYGYAGDNLGAIHYFWWWKKSLLSGLNHRDSYLEEAPFGVTIDRESGAAFYYLPLKFLTLLTNEVFAYNLVLLLSFPAAASALFFLAYALTKNAAASFVAGLIYSFSPYHFWKAYNHLDLALIWPLPLYVWALWRMAADWRADLHRSRLFGDSALLGGLLAVVVLTNFYYGYFMLLFTAVFFLGFLFPRRSDLHRKVGPSKEDSWLYRFIALALASLISLAVILPFTYQTLEEARQPGGEGQSLFKQEAFNRPLNNLISLSARPWDYLIPSQDHPLWGKYVPSLYEWIRAKSADFKTVSAPPHERTIYLGWIALLMSGVTVFLLLKSENFRQRYGRVSAAFLFAALALVVVSLPPFIIVKGQQFNFPSFYLYRFFPMFRSYARLGIVVLLCLAVLAAAAIPHLLELIARTPLAKNHRRPSSFFILVLLSFLVLFDFANIPPAKVIDFSITPSAYRWLAKQSGEKIILEWPPSFNVVEGFLWQRAHQKGIANWSRQSPYYSLWQFLPDLYLPTVSRKLAGLGVDYVFVHKKLLFPQVNPVDDLWYTRAVKDPERYKTAPAGMSLALESRDINVFSVDKENPAKVLTVTDRWGKIDVRVLGGDGWRWFGEGNHFYLYNLLEEEKEIKTWLSYSLSDEDRKKLKGISFNGQNLILTGGRPVLTLRPGENDLWFFLNKDYPRQASIDFQKISLLLEL